MKLRTLVMVAALAAPFSLMAQAPEEPESPWSGSATLGYLATSGNTETSTLNTGFEVGYTKGKWDHLLTAKAINSSEDNVTTAESYAIGWKSERNLTDHDFLFGRLSLIDDRFGGYATQFSQTVGYGRRLINTISTSSMLRSAVVRGSPNCRMESPRMRRFFMVACTTNGISARQPSSART